MLKSSALQQKRIAICLAVMLMFCAFCLDGTEVGEWVCFTEASQQKIILRQPEAGEFFAGSLPNVERQSVRAGEWQIVPGFRSSRARGIGNGPKGTEVCIAQYDGLSRLPVAGESPRGETGLPITPGRQIIVCYIHNQDGQKG